MKVLIAGIPRVDVLLNLYNNAHCQGVAYDRSPQVRALAIMTKDEMGDRAKAEGLIKA